MKRVLVTGATGFVGRQALAPLAARGYEVHAVSRHGTSATGVTVHSADLLDELETATLIARIRPTHLLHLAWYAAHGRFWTAPQNTQWVAATAGLLEAFASNGGQRAVLAGTCAEYDWGGDGVCDETATPLAAATLYGQSKNQVRVQFEAVCRARGLSGAWGRIFHVYGPHEAPERFVAYVATQLLRGEEAACSPGAQRRDFLHVADVADAFCSLLDSDVRGPVNLGSGERVTLADVAGRIARLAGHPSRLRLGARLAAPDDPAQLVPSTRRLFNEVRWRPRYDLSRGLAETVAWWRQHLAIQGVQRA